MSIRGSSTPSTRSISICIADQQVGSNPSWVVRKGVQEPKQLNVWITAVHPSSLKHDFDPFVAKFAIDGTHLWSRRYGDGTTQYGNRIAVSPTGAVWVTGHYVGLMDFGVGLQLSSGAGYDAFWVSVLP